MKKFSFLLLFIISLINVKGTPYIPSYSHEYLNKSNVECIYNPARDIANLYCNLKLSHKTTANNFTSIKNFLLVNKLSLLHFNNCIILQLKLNDFRFTFHINYLKIPERNTSYLSSDENLLG